jgi:hypothetical protein
MSFLNVNVANENIVVLNDNYQYEASAAAQAENAKWIDLTNVVSVKRDKTIYAVRARNSYAFNANLSQTYFFANTTTAYTLLQNGNTLQYNSGTQFNSDIFKNFGTASSTATENQNILMTRYSSVYGNLSEANNMGTVGICGSLDKASFAYINVNNGINVSSKVTILGNLSDATITSFNGQAFSSNISGNVMRLIPASAGNANINANGTCFQQVSFTNWNRLINANISGTTLVNSSTDPCDKVGAPVINVPGISGSVLTNEAYRHQFKLRANAQQSASSNNPTYIARVSRFGQSLSDAPSSTVQIASKLALHSFTSNFFASIPTDNQVYATNASLLTGLNLSGNLTVPALVVVNSNFTTGNLYNTVSGKFNGNVTDSSSLLAITANPISAPDYIAGTNGILTANGDIEAGASFQTGDIISFVQANTILKEGYLLMDRISLSASDSSYMLASNVFSGQTNDPNPTLGLNNASNYANLWIQANLSNNLGSNEMSAKYLTITGSNIIADNWTETNYMAPDSMEIPTASLISNIYTSEQSLNLYVRRGDISFTNYSYVQNTTISPGVPYQPVTVPGFVTNMKWGGNLNGNANVDIILSSNILEDNQDMTINATKQVPIRLPGANVSIQANVACNYQLVVSGNVAETNRVNKAGNVVAPTNFANSFIANAWSYNNLGVATGTPAATSTVNIVYAGSQIINGVNIGGLDLSSADAATVPQYTVKFERSVGSTSAPAELTNSNFSFFANTFQNGKYSSNVRIQDAAALALDNNPHLANLVASDVAYSSYDLGNNSLKFTDISGILNLTNGGNYSYAYYLPEAVTNSNVSTAQPSYKSESDTYLNIITDYNVFNALPGDSTDVHQVTLYDFKYRYGIQSIQSAASGSSYVPTSIFINGDVFNPSTNFLVNSGETDVNRDLMGNVEAPAISLYTYENVSGVMNYDDAYPFCLPNVNYQIPTNGTLFPGWSTTTTNGQINYLGNQTNVDFKIPSNTNASQIMSLKIHSQSTNSDGIPYIIATLTGAGQSQTASIPVKAVLHGKASNGTQRYATPILCGVIPTPVSTNYTDYVILMVELVDNAPGSGIVPELINSVTTIEVLPMKNGSQQMRFNASLRSFAQNSAVPYSSPVVNNNWSFLTPVNSLAAPIDTAAPGSGLQVEVYRKPSNQSIVSFVYRASVVKELLSFTRTDYALNGLSSGYIAMPSITSFASSNKNATVAAVSDVSNPSLPMQPANSNRYYIDSVNSPVFVDVSLENNSNQPLGVMTVGRAIEWTLWKGASLVGRGLMSKGISSGNNIVNTFLVHENLASSSSGFALQVQTNLTNLASRLLLQQITSNANAQAPNQWVIKTKADELNVTVLRMDPTESNSLFTGTPSVAANLSKSASIQLTTSNANIDLGSVLNGANGVSKFITINLQPVRGFGFNPSIATLANNMIDLSVFTINIQPDSYAAIWVKPSMNATTGGVNVNQTNVLFSDNNNVQGIQSPLDFKLSFGNKTLAAQYASTTSPDLSTSDFSLIANYYFAGYGEITYSIDDFTSNYDVQLNNISLEAGVRKPFGPQSTDDSSYSAWKVAKSTSTKKSTPIAYDQDRQKYYFEIGVVNKDRVYFKNSTLQNLPTFFNNKSALLLYTGLRPLVMNALTMVNSNTNLETAITSAGLFRWAENDVNGAISIQNIFTSIAPTDSVSNPGAAALAEQNYQIVLTNTSTTNGFKFRSVKYAPSTGFYTLNTANRIFLATYLASSIIFQNLRLNVVRQSGTTSFALKVALGLDKYVNPQLGDDILKNSALPKNDGTFPLQSDLAQNSYLVSCDENSLGLLFNLNVNGTLPAGLFQVDINPATLSVYAANDSNNNGELDELTASNITTATVNGLTNNFALNNMFSELMFNLPSLPNNSQNVRNPTPVASWELTRDYRAFPGCPFDIQMSNRWSVGYNLDCLFAIQQNNCVQLDVITISTKLTTNASGQTVSGLVVENTAPLIVRNPTDWARSLVSENPNNMGKKSGLSFKLNLTSTESPIIKAGSVVRLFVDNVLQNNWLEWNVKTSALPAAGKSVKINLYDQERYAELLDEQLNINNSLN